MRSLVVTSLALVVVLHAGCYRSRVRGADAGPRADAGALHDAARGDAAAPVACSEESLPEYDGPRCSDAVNACRDACPGRDEPCRDACLDAPCRDCIYGTIFHCANESGCEPLWREFACCVESVSMCSALRGFDRVDCATSCPMRFEPYAHCIEDMGGEACFLRAARDCGVH